MPYFKHDSINFFYEDDDNGKEPFIFLHGLGGIATQTITLLDGIPNIRRISIDLRGHGKTIYYGREEDLSFSTYADDIIALADSLNLDTFMIGGVSMGSSVALNVAIRYPERVSKLIMSRLAWLNGQMEEKNRKIFETIYNILIDKKVENKQEYFKETDVYKDLLKESLFISDSVLGQFNYMYAEETASKLIRIPNDAPYNSDSELNEIKIPTLVLATKEDPIHTLDIGKKISKEIKKSKFIRVTSNEESVEKHNEEVKVEIEKFLEKN